MSSKIKMNKEKVLNLLQKRKHKLLNRLDEIDGDIYAECLKTKVGIPFINRRNVTPEEAKELVKKSTYLEYHRAFHVLRIETVENFIKFVELSDDAMIEICEDDIYNLDLERMIDE